MHSLRISGPEDFGQAFGVSAATLDRLGIYVDLLIQWQQRINLVGSSTLETLWLRHIADGAQVLALGDAHGQTWIDLGTGAGIPGMVIAILLAEGGRGHVHLVESNQKKAAFLREVIRKTGARATIHAQRIEAIDPRTMHPVPLIVTARALAPLAKLLDFARPWLEDGALGVFLKGQDVDDELTEAAKYWRIKVRKQPSRIDPRGCVLLVEEAHRADT
jgi:16S rRNA (guanine527-N7)-methyltransferase